MKAKKHSGFSLLELLVAVAILAVVVTPLLMSFTQAAKVNNKAKKLEVATVVASNEVEEIRVASKEDLIASCTKNADGTYSYEKESTMDGKDFTTVVTFDGRYDDSVDGDEITDYNATPIASFTMMNQAYDAMYEHSSETDRSYAVMLKGNESLSGIKRNIEVSMEKVDDTTTVKITTHYTYGGQTASTAPLTIYSNKRDEVDLRNVYIFFDPLTSSQKSSDIKDVVTIYNESLLPVNVYVAAQDLEAIKNTYPSYICNIRVKETKRKVYKDANGDLQILTDLRSNLSGKNLKLTYATANSYDTRKLTSGGSLAAADIVNLGELSGKITGDLVYHVSVETYLGKGNERETESLVKLETSKQ